MAQSEVDRSGYTPPKLEGKNRESLAAVLKMLEGGTLALDTQVSEVPSPALSKGESHEKAIDVPGPNERILQIRGPGELDIRSDKGKSYEEVLEAASAAADEFKARLEKAMEGKTITTHSVAIEGVKVIPPSDPKNVADLSKWHIETRVVSTQFTNNTWAQLDDFFTDEKIEMLFSECFEEIDCDFFIREGYNRQSRAGKKRVNILDGDRTHTGRAKRLLATHEYSIRQRGHEHSHLLPVLAEIKKIAEQDQLYLALIDAIDKADDGDMILLPKDGMMEFVGKYLSLPGVKTNLYFEYDAKVVHHGVLQNVGQKAIDSEPSHRRIASGTLLGDIKKFWDLKVDVDGKGVKLHNHLVPLNTFGIASTQDYNGIKAWREKIEPLIGKKLTFVVEGSGENMRVVNILNVDS